MPQEFHLLTPRALTVLTLVPNAGDRLQRCLDSVAWADCRFCVIDPRTNDGSEKIAQERAERAVVHEYKNAADQRNWAIPQIATEWTLVLDADEWVSPPLRARIEEIVRGEGGPNGYKILRLSYFFGRLIRHGGWERDYNVRLFRTQHGRYLERRVHSRIEVAGEMGRIDVPMYHDTYRSFEEYFATFQRFTSWSAQDLFDEGYRPTTFDLTLRPLSRFLKMYLMRGGWRDGMHGAVLCGLAAFSVFTKYAKLWHLWRVADGQPLAPPGNFRDVP